MTIREEKIQFVQNLLNVIKDKESAQNQLRELLLKDTNNGKLYKYRVANKKNLDCLRDGTLFCASPDTFNDPFDCKIGYSFLSLLNGMFETELDELEILMKQYLSMLDGNLFTRGCSENNKKVLNAWLNNKRLTDYFKGLNKSVEKSVIENELLNDYSFVIGDLLKPLKKYDGQNSKMSIINAFMPEIIKSVTKNGLHNDCISFDDYAKGLGVDGDVDEIEKVLILNRKLSPNSSKEGESIQRVFKNAEEHISVKMNRLFRIGCLATDYKNRLMWSHYSDSHKGYCVEYDFSGTDANTLEILPLPIIYSSNRPLIPWKAVIEKNEKNLEEANRDILVGLLTKDEAWEYENEWRIIVHESSNPLLEMPPIKCVYLGANINEYYRRRILKIGKAKGFQVKQMVVDRGAYELREKSFE